jgi:hypothetical protein
MFQMPAYNRIPALSEQLCGAFSDLAFHRALEMYVIVGVPVNAEMSKTSALPCGVV